MLTTAQKEGISHLLRHLVNQSISQHPDWYLSGECARLCTRAMYVTGRKHLKVDEIHTPDGASRYRATFLRWGMGWEQGETRNEAIVRAALHADGCGCV